MPHIVIAQPYVPEYRVAFFEGLRERLAFDEIECTVAAGNPPGPQADRGDAASADWIIEVPNRRLALGSRSVLLGSSRSAWKEADAVILGLLGSSIDSYRAVLDRRHGLRVGFWGHIAPYVNDPHPLDLAAERWLLRRADHVFAYTPGGARFASMVGVASWRITTVMNTTSATQLRQARQDLTPQMVEEFKSTNGLTGHPTLGYIGGLDASKRVEFFASTLDEIWSQDPSVRVVIAGHGEQAHLLDRALERGQIVRVGYADQHVKALIGLSSGALLNPGRIGLTAVDALVLGRPILTASRKYHAPEVEYLIEGVSLFTTNDDAAQFAAIAVEQAMANQGPADWSYPTLEMMIENFAEGVRRLLRG